MTMRATQKNRMSWPVSRRLPGKCRSKSAVLRGHPSAANGKSDDENHVSRTSSSWYQGVRACVGAGVCGCVCVCGGGGGREQIDVSA
jgi:hypothetical protein